MTDNRSLSKYVVKLVGTFLQLLLLDFCKMTLIRCEAGSSIREPVNNIDMH